MLYIILGLIALVLSIICSHCEMYFKQLKQLIIEKGVSVNLLTRVDVF